MKNRNILKLSVIFFLTIGFNYALFGQTKITSEHTSIYFKDRITYAFSENGLIPFNGSNKLKSGEVGNTKAKIWHLWKLANTDFDQLPTLTNDSEAKATLQHWDLPNEDPMPFYFIKKDGDKLASRYPMFINLHGSGPKANEFRAAVALSKMYDDAPSVYFIPQIPNEKRYRWWYQPEQFAWEKLFRLAMLNEDIDYNKIYIMGISEGGYGSQRLGAYYADYLAGAGPMAGGEPLENAPPLNYRNIAFSFQTGENDRGFGRNTYTAAAKSAFDSLSKLNPGEFIHKIELQKDRGHAIDYTVTTPWLVQYSRTPNPMHVSWVYFPMHNRYRKGFYNIGIEEHPGMKEGDDLDRAYFDIRFDRDQNLITIQAYMTDGELSRTEAFKKGRIAVFLNEKHVDLSKKVKVVYNGKMIFNRNVSLDEKNLIESCALFGDPERLFPAKIEVKL